MTTSMTLLEFSTMVKRMFSQQLGGDYWVVAEIGEMKVHHSGHAYLDLVEKQGERLAAKMRATIWASTYSQLAPWFEQQTGERLKGGMKVLALVKINFHEVYGLSLNVTQIDPRFTLGERARKRQEVINKLTEEGVIDQNHEIPYPLVPNRIAVVSSEQAAGFEDFTRQIQNNRYGYKFELTLFPVVLQGDMAVSSINEAFKRIDDRSHEFDTVAIIRGGGSQLDLDTFDSYELSLSIINCKLPVITGIGHEKDETIADIVAKIRVKTPTAAAEFFIKSVLEFEERLVMTFEKVRNITNRRIGLEDNRITTISSRIKSSALNRITLGQSKIMEIRSRSKYVFQKVLDDAQHRLGLLKVEIEQHNPEKILKKGYTISLIDGLPVDKLSELKSGMEMLTISSNQEIKSTITNADKRNGK